MQFAMVSYMEKTRGYRRTWCRTEVGKAVRKVNWHPSALFMQKLVTLFPKQQELHSVWSGDTEELVRQLH